jgi:hypothetical protein
MGKSMIRLAILRQIGDDYRVEVSNRVAALEDVDVEE